MSDENAPASGVNNTGDTPTPEAKTNGENGGQPSGTPKISDEDVINHPVYKGVYGDLKKARADLAERKKADDERAAKELEDQGKHKELAEKAIAERDDYKGRYEQTAKRNAFLTAAAAAGVKLVDDAWKLADHSKLSLDDDGNVTGAEEVVKALVESRPFLVGEAVKPNVGAPSSPAGDVNTGEKPTYKRSQLRDTDFFEKNRADIMKAAKEGRIIDDITT